MVAEKVVVVTLSMVMVVTLVMTASSVMVVTKHSDDDGCSRVSDKSSSVPVNDSG